jgi:hypothetical protein
VRRYAPASGSPFLRLAFRSERRHVSHIRVTESHRRTVPDHRIPGKARRWCRASVCRDLRCLPPIANSRFPRSGWRHLHLRGMPGGRRAVH